MSSAEKVLGPGKRRIAVVGTGVAGLLAAERLALRHDVTVFEKETRIGGHTHTVDVEGPAGKVAVDTGFIVCNDRTYPGFLALMKRLGVPLRDTEMSFSVRCERTGLEYNGRNLRTIFAQKRNLLRPSFLGMLRDILRFHKVAYGYRESELGLGEVLRREGFGRAFAEHYLVPMMAAIWSAEPDKLMAMPARFFVSFFHNHGMLTVEDRPQWMTVVGGSRSYLEPLTRSFCDRIRSGDPVVAVRRIGDEVEIRTQSGQTSRHDGVVLAAHSDESLALLADADEHERGVLGAIPYQENDVVLHTDASLLPKRKVAWAAWNYHLADTAERRATVTYCMNILQGYSMAPGATIYNVTLNRTAAIDPSKILRKFVYHHPVFDGAGVAAQERVPAMFGHRRVWMCGAWCGFGFHEDGVRSALRVAADFGIDAEATA